MKLRFAVSCSLALDFECELIDRAHIPRVASNSLAEIGDGGRGIAAGALQRAQIGVNLAVVRSELVRPVQPLLRLFEVALPQRQNSPVRPGRRLTRRKLGRLFE